MPLTLTSKTTSFPSTPSVFSARGISNEGATEIGKLEKKSIKLWIGTKKTPQYHNTQECYLCNVFVFLTKNSHPSQCFCGSSIICANNFVASSICFCGLCHDKQMVVLVTLNGNSTDWICQYTTRPDTRPPVADGWAGAEMLVFPLFDSCSRTDRPTDRPTDGRTDKASYRVACPQLKTPAF